MPEDNVFYAKALGKLRRIKSGAVVLFIRLKAISIPEKTKRLTEQPIGILRDILAVFVTRFVAQTNKGFALCCRSSESKLFKLGGVDIKNIDENILYEKITRVRHDSYLFKGTVFDNLLMGITRKNLVEKYGVVLNEHEQSDILCNGSLENAMYNVLKQVDLYDTIIEKGGLMMPIEEKASNLSGGQKQRLVLARAILHHLQST